MSTLPVNVRGVRQSIPSGYVLGRTSAGTGPPELIDVKSLGQAVTVTGAGGSPSPAIPVQVQESYGYFNSATTITMGSTVTAGNVLLVVGMGARGSSHDLTLTSAATAVCPGSVLLADSTIS